MLAAQLMFGPHHTTTWAESGLAVGRNLFRRVPEDRYDLQIGANERFVLAADVRLDNRDELIAELRLAPEAARTESDAGILLQCLDRWDEAALERLAGDFAFALWDRRSRSLRLARDFLGQQPLHYHRADGFFAFASMPAGLHALPEIPYGADEQAVAEFLALLPREGSRSFFKSIERVEPGHILTVSQGSISTRAFWEPTRKNRAKLTFQDSIEGIRFHLDQATQARLRGCGGTVGTHLSGGLDSSAVTATAAKLLEPLNGKVTAFTYVPREGYPAPNLRGLYGDEGPLAKQTANLYPNIEHVPVRAGHLSPLDYLDKVFFLYASPFLGLGVLPPLEEINMQARARRLSVLLTGAMGNMSLSYEGLELLPELLRAGRLPSLFRKAREVHSASEMRWRRVLATAFGPFVPVWVWQLLNSYFTGHKQDVLQYSALKSEALTTFDLTRLARERNLDFSYRPSKDGFDLRLWVLRRNDNGTINKGTLGGWGLDRRAPLADKRLVEFCLGLPTEHFIPNGTPRGLARAALADRLPKAVLVNQKRGYNSIDWHEGATSARTDIAAELNRISACLPAQSMLDIDRLKRLVDDWPTEGWARANVQANYRLALLRGISAGHFLRKASGANVSGELDQDVPKRSDAPDDAKIGP